jgi:hypothetical protein
MQEVTGKQPWYVPFVLWAGPVFWALVLAFLNFNSVRIYGKIYFHTEDWVLHGFGVAFLALPLFLPYRQVTAVPDRIVAQHYLGRSVALPWHEIRRVEIVSFGIPEAQTRTLNLIPCNGRKISFSSQMSNFEALADAVLARTVAPIVRKRPLT